MMSEQERVQRPASTRPEEVASSTTLPSNARSAQLKNDLDSLLDEIDEVLEENAEEFVRNYVQKGGE
jgi:ubiquitin-like protein Pup